jgi:hypothetical protein
MSTEVASAVPAYLHIAQWVDFGDQKPKHAHQLSDHPTIVLPEYVKIYFTPLLSLLHGSIFVPGQYYCSAAGTLAR